MNLKSKLQSGDRVLNGQVNILPTAVATQAIAAAGTDFVIIDQEHGPIGRDTLHAMIAATQGTGCAPTVRVPSVDEIAVKIALDAGAEGIVFPLIRGVEDAERCVAAMRYPPRGTRGWGPFVAHSRWQVPLHGYLPGPAEDTVCMLLIETIEAVDQIEAICAVDGVDCVVVASFDLSTNLGVPGQMDHPRMTDAVARIEKAARDAGLPLSGVAFSEDAARDLIDRGYRVLVGFDVLWLKSAVAQSVAWGQPG